MKKLIFLILFLNLNSIFAFTFENMWVHFDTIYSANREFHLISIRQSCEIEVGITSVFRTSTNEKMYTINRYLWNNDTLDNIFLSNDGRTLLYLDFEKNHTQNKIELFYNGNLTKSIKLDSLISDFHFFNSPEFRITKHFPSSNFDNSEEGKIYISNKRDVKYKGNVEEKIEFADKFPAFYFSDTVYLVNKDFRIIKINLNTLTVDIDKLSKLNFSQDIHPVFINHVEFSYKLSDDLPDKKLIGEELGKKINYKNVKNINTNLFSSRLRVSGYLKKDSSFKVEKFSIEGNLPKIDYIKFFENRKYSTEIIPDYADKWFVSAYWDFRNLNDSIARVELIEEKKKLETADSINGEYIPKDIYDAVNQMDLLLPKEDQDKIVNLKSVNDLNEYGFKIGINLERRWNLWYGSRLSKYLNRYNISSPSALESILIEAYWYYKHDSVLVLPDFSDNTVFKIDSNLFVFVNPESGITKYTAQVQNSQIIIKDSNGRYIYSPGFLKTKQQWMDRWSYFFSIYDKYVNDKIILSPNSTNDIFNKIDHYRGVHYRNIFDYEKALIIFNYYNITTSFNKFINNLLKQYKNNSYLLVLTGKIFFELPRVEIEKLDSKFSLMLNNIDEISDSEFEDEINEEFYEFLKQYEVSDLFIVKMYPLLRFDFSKEKLKQKK